jgi:addiction module HigA family antidote
MARLAIHPGEHVQEEIEALGLDLTTLSAQLGVSAERLASLVDGHTALDADMALRLGHFFGIRPEFWMNLQDLYELRTTEQQLGDTIRSLPTVTQLRAA